ncbi:MAG TPA: hypothetical protein IAB18_03005 [Candidatus Avisuccinivibrio pullicola]|nr:hypothetical protein [Candidatus Avisuccinivibrio pullicola]
MNLNDIDAYDLLSKENPLLLKEIAEEVAQMEFTLRRILDRGVKAQEFDSLNALYIAAQTAGEIVATLRG